MGRTGVESAYDDRLRGENGEKIIEENALGDVIGEHAIKAPSPGGEVTLSVDAGLSEAMYQIIATTSAQAGFRSGAAAIINVHTGELLALTSFPSYDPEVMADGDEIELERLAERGHDLLELALPQDAVVDEDAGEAAAERLVAQHRGDRRVDAARETADGVLVCTDAVLHELRGAGQRTGIGGRGGEEILFRLARDKRVLDLYTYMGGFALAAANAGARSVLAVDRSEPALTLAAEAARRNKLADRVTFRRGEVFAVTESLIDAGERFDIVIADPPAFVKSKKELNQGARGYRKLARLAATLVKPGGFLFIASCSHNMPADEFGEQVRRGLFDAGRSGRILARTGAAPDHPLHPALPESAYLKAELIALD